MFYQDYYSVLSTTNIITCNKKNEIFFLAFVIPSYYYYYYYIYYFYFSLPWFSNAFSTGALMQLYQKENRWEIDTDDRYAK